jgi:hypothetical protein
MKLSSLTIKNNNFDFIDMFSNLKKNFVIKIFIIKKIYEII